jgi:hypothetical protein
VSSDNQAAIAISGPVNGTSFTVVPNPVVADTTVTLTVRDTGTAPLASTIVTVKPGTVNNSVTITPTDGDACHPGFCSGSDALVSTTISQGGVPLAARSVRFEVVTGTFAFVTTTNGVDSLSSSITVITDETGKAVARIRIPAGAANQGALIQITDLGTGTFIRTSFSIVQSTGSTPGFSVLPSSVAFVGPTTNQCAGADNTQGAQFTIVGGVAPYSVSSSTSAFTVFPSTVSASGGTFVAKPNGTCSPTPGTTFIVTDSSGHTATATATNSPGTTAPPALAVTPDTVTLTSCSGKASASVAGGTGKYFASSGSDAVDVSQVVDGTFTVSRRNPSGAVPPDSSNKSSVNVGVSDGTSVVNLEVDLAGTGKGDCPALHASPPSVTLTSCAAQTVTLSGGSGTYNPTSSNQSVTATMTTPTTLSIQRTSPSTSFSGSATIVVQNGGDQITVPVNATGAGLGACP